MLQWPALPFPKGLSVEGYSHALSDGRVSVPTDSQIPLTRLLSLVAPQIVSAMVKVNTAWKGRLDKFWNDETVKGTLPFWLRDQEYDGQPELDENYELVLDENGDPSLYQAYWLCQFKPDAGPIRYSPIGRIWYAASFELLILPIG